MDFLRTHPGTFREALEPESMYVGALFSAVVDGVMHLSWHLVQDEGAADVREPSQWLVEQHVAFWPGCINPDFAPQDFTPEST